MSPVRPARSRRLTAAVTAALAVTAGTLAAAPAALAATTVSAPAAPAEVIPFPLGSEIVSAGATGFLSRNTAGGYRWTRLADGASSVVASQAPVLAGASDILVTTTGDRVLHVQDMASGAAPVAIDLKALTDGVHTAFGAVGATVLTSVTTPTGAVEPHLVGSAADGAVSNRPVTGLPAGSGSFTLVSAVKGTALVGFQADGKSRLAVIDLATSTVTETYENPRPSADSPTAALSATHVAWVERQRTDYQEVVVTDRSTGAVQRFAANPYGRVDIGLTGSWLVHETRRNAQSAFDAKSLATEPAKQILTHATSLATAPDGTLLVRGGSLAEGEGEGLYRVAADADGDITRQLVARTGEPTGVVVRGHNIPQVLDLDKNRGVVPFTIDVSRAATVRLSLVPGDNAYCGDFGSSAWSASGSTAGAGSVTMTWEGSFRYPDGGWLSSGAARNGTWTWCTSVSPLDGVGPPAEQKGTFTVTRRPHPHDFSDNGSADPLMVDDKGVLRSADGDHSPSAGWVTWGDSAHEVRGTGWNIYDRFTVPGDLGGTAEPDVVTRDRSGGLWLYPGDRNVPAQLGGRKRIGTNWGVYDKISGTSDVTGDGKPDLLAADRSGDLWLYPGTGNIDAPLGGRKKIGGGWGVYNQIAATGNLAGAPAGDLVARDGAGVLWLYLGKGDGTFASRVRIGGGWNEYSRFITLGDVTRDGRADLVVSFPDPGAYGGEGGYLYESTGDWREPFKPRRNAYTPGSAGDIAVF
ncbi:FG-GAP repeat domain-containing protein [Streptomyces sp. NBC_00691]|uniref:FG-GAP repeat domain-containing protein n=1 Tax=Streptomyces sp. NBC_00691 TaxID=2903671 RepID=UPI002E342E9A|nr:FG-GAP-like repeat-containing protein [Streptomyces sp. NBC_00691]